MPTLIDQYYAFILDGVEPQSKAHKAAFKIIHDLSDRRGLRQEYEQIDDDVKEELIQSWVDAIQEVFA